LHTLGNRRAFVNKTVIFKKKENVIAFFLKWRTLRRMHISY